jgi:hypothetical protein
MKLLRSTIVFLSGLGLAACARTGPFEASGSPSRSLSVAVGEEMIIQIGGVGPGYSSPPTITGSAIVFLEETYPPGAATPGGVLQLFHFKGQAIVLFHNPAGSANIFPDVIDTVVVR